MPVEQGASTLIGHAHLRAALVVDGNPLERFSDLRRVWLVVAAGRRYEPAPLWRSVGFQP